MGKSCSNCRFMKFSDCERMFIEDVCWCNNPKSNKYLAILLDNEIVSFAYVDGCDSWRQSIGYCLEKMGGKIG